MLQTASGHANLLLALTIASNHATPAHVVIMRDYVAWQILRSTGIDSASFKDVVLGSGGDHKLWSQLSKSAQSVLVQAGFEDWTRGRLQRRGRPSRRIYSQVAPILRDMDAAS
jgi:hypothetical protein